MERVNNQIKGEIIITQENKELLLKDLCARLPYGVKVTNGIHIITLTPCSDTSIIIKNGHILPYLRPMSSMTWEERKYLQKLSFPYDFVDWLNAHHFDYRGLIEKGLALEATEEMYENNKTEIYEMC